MPSQFASAMGQSIGGTAGYASQAKSQLQQWPETYPIQPDPPTWNQLVQFQGTVIQLQQEVIRLQRELDKIKNTKDWLVGPESDNLSVAGDKTP